MRVLPYKVKEVRQAFVIVSGGPNAEFPEFLKTKRLLIIFDLYSVFLLYYNKNTYK